MDDKELIEKCESHLTKLDSIVGFTLETAMPDMRELLTRFRTLTDQRVSVDEIMENIKGIAQIETNIHNDDRIIMTEEDYHISYLSLSHLRTALTNLMQKGGKG